MLHFLRRIRRSLINTGATRKYLLYAVGEILLVMIGILLALQVNNWNEERKDRFEEQVILIGLEKQFLSLNQHLNYWALAYDSLSAKTRRVLHPKANISDISHDYILYAFGGITISVTFDPGRGILESTIESGRLELIQNEELREMLSNWSHMADEISDGEVTMRNFISREIIPYMSSKGLGTFSGNIKYSLHQEPFYDTELDENDFKYFLDLLDDKHFLGLATWRYQWLEYSKGEYYDGVELSQKILELIRSELKS
jgi:hypothetical protein